MARGGGHAGGGQHERSGGHGDAPPDPHHSTVRHGRRAFVDATRHRVEQPGRHLDLRRGGLCLRGPNEGRDALELGGHRIIGRA
jgi:hypothetical protein